MRSFIYLMVPETDFFFLEKNSTFFFSIVQLFNGVLVNWVKNFLPELLLELISANIKNFEGKKPTIRQYQQ